MSNATAPSILGLLAWEPMTGYELKSAIEDSIGNFWSESFGQIYPELRKLEAAGLVSAESEGEDSGKPKRRYAITDAGRAALADWLAQPPRRRPPRNELLLKLFFGAQAEPDRLLDYVRDLRRQHATALEALTRKEAHLQAAYQGDPGLPFWLITLRNGKASYAASIAWCDETIGALEAMQSPIAKRKAQP